ncbi:MAG: chondroitin AC/alginate lyase [Monoraphidium minutum]|nr:MAG: chondroitin AC/alginate lyase [Monoraphidium minutum]
MLALPEDCRDEWQLVMCSEVAATDAGPEAVASCCAAHVARPAEPAIAGVVQQGQDVGRPDLDADAVYDWRFRTCVPLRHAELPTFSRDSDGTTQVKIVRQPVPELRSDLIRRIKTAALAAAPEQIPAAMRSLRERDAAARPIKEGSFQHPGGYVGAAELALLQSRLEGGEPLTMAAKTALLTGRGIPIEYKSSGWYVPVNAPRDYWGPMAMEKVLTDWGGWHKWNSSPCPPNYPSDAPAKHCGHFAFVEMDASISYRSALAYVATGDEQYARNARDAVMGWAATNKVFGIEDRNGPLEAGWGLGAMARTMQLLRATWPGFHQSDLDKFVGWVDAVLMPQMDYYVDGLNPGLLKGRAKETVTYGNWPATIADAYMALGVLADDRARYDKGYALYRAVVEGYFKWGRGKWSRGRIIGETTETLRDVYHTLFGLGSLIQAAETAWGQDSDAYKEQEYVLAASLELHARIINAHEEGDEAALPPGFKFFESMPKAPHGCSWSWDIKTQDWTAYRKGDGSKCADQKDKTKYLLGIKYLPTGFEIGYNHFVGRLGMSMPETAKLLRRHPVDWHAFCWGLGTLTHADTARDLWRAGVTPEALCEPARGRGDRGQGYDFNPLPGLVVG